ncbi:MAG: hypothetical protein IT233_13560 [Bacteroidia bacterium]|nr:hypothetical protein [Bacteroidia bacterium]
MRSAFFLLSILASAIAAAQCCSAGSGSPVAGGTSQGVLQEKQMEISTHFQHIYTGTYYRGSEKLKDTTTWFSSNYLYLRTAIGLSKKLTFSVESGYYLNRTDFLNDSLSYQSGGIGDLILFPRYEVYSKACESHKTEIVLGLGFKIPLGKYNDSIGMLEPFSGTTIYFTMPPAVQPSTGANDVILYGFYYRELLKPELKVFSSLVHVHKGWNPLGEKFGNYTALGLFVSKVFKKKLGVTLQLKTENIERMKYNEDAYMMGSYLYDVDATGSEKLFLVPQLSYGFFKGKLLYYISSEFPVYQRLNKAQVASERFITTGLSWRFFANKPFTKKES